jgi:hypothetical protein
MRRLVGSASAASPALVSPLDRRVAGGAAWPAVELERLPAQLYRRRAVAPHRSSSDAGVLLVVQLESEINGAV